MHERQAVVVVVSILIFSVIFATESFAQKPQCNGLDATHVGTNDNDIIRGSFGDDIIVALGGNDIVYGMSGNDVICGGDGNDRLYGNSGNDILIGQEGFDKLDGGKGIDTCDFFTDHHSSSHHSDDEDDDCETQYQETPVNNDDLQKQIDYLQSQINDIINDVIYWDDIQEIPADIADGDDDTLGEITCNTDSGILVFDGISWICENNNFKLECTNEQILKFDGEKWVCSDLPNIDFSDTLSELNCVDGEIPKKNGEEWICSVDLNDSAEPNKASSAIFFHFGLVTKGQIEWVGTSTQTYDPLKIDEASLVMPTSGTLSNLFAKTGTFLAKSPGVGQSYKLTLLVNGLETTPSLSCIIADDSESCSDKINEIFVNEGDVLVLKIEASKSAPFAYISSSVLLT